MAQCQSTDDEYTTFKGDCYMTVGLTIISSPDAEQGTTQLALRACTRCMPVVVMALRLRYNSARSDKLLGQPNKAVFVCPTTVVSQMQSH